MKWAVEDEQREVGRGGPVRLDLGQEGVEPGRRSRTRRRSPAGSGVAGRCTGRPAEWRATACTPRRPRRRPRQDRIDRRQLGCPPWRATFSTTWPIPPSARIEDASCRGRRVDLLAADLRGDVVKRHPIMLGVPHQRRRQEQASVPGSDMSQGQGERSHRRAGRVDWQGRANTSGGQRSMAYFAKTTDAGHHPGGRPGPAAAVERSPSPTKQVAAAQQKNSGGSIVISVPPAANIGTIAPSSERGQRQPVAAEQLAGEPVGAAPRCPPPAAAAGEADGGHRIAEDRRNSPVNEVGDQRSLAVVPGREVSGPGPVLGLVTGQVDRAIVGEKSPTGPQVQQDDGGENESSTDRGSRDRRRKAEPPVAYGCGGPLGSGIHSARMLRDARRRFTAGRLMLSEQGARPIMRRRALRRYPSTTVVTISQWSR